MDAKMALRSNRLSESEVIFLLLFFMIRSGGAYASGWLGVVKQVQDVIHEVILMRVLLVVKPCLEGLLKDSHYVGAVGC
jgi:hypothetical protein